MKLRLLIVLLPFAIVALFLSATAHAATFDPGRIIDDTIFTDATSMSASDIQVFLNSKVSTCDTAGTMPATDFGRSDLNHKDYAAMKGWSAPPYTCLKDYSEGGRSAAQIIYDVAQQSQINPRVFIVLLQKEAGLVTDTWPLASQYKTATGYGCPDSTPGVCDSSYFGFTNQLTWAGRLFRSVINQSPTWYSPYIKGSNYIQWSPVASCGGSTVSIQNWSTAALYDYTPYQPNAAALAAGYGRAPNNDDNGCAAYGNRNFFLYYTDWFGSTTAPDYAWQPIGQAAFTDSTKTKVIGWNSSAVAGQRVYVRIVVKNTGNKTWYRDNSWPQVQIGTDGPLDQPSAMCDTTWIRCSRAATHLEPTVAPGEMATFEFWATTPSKPGVYGQSFNLVADGLVWMKNSGLYMQFQSIQPTYTWQFAGQAVYTDSTKSTLMGWNANVAPGQRVYTVIKAKNTGNVPWYKTGHTPQVQIGTGLPNDHNSQLCDKTWIRCSRAAVQEEDTVNPGEVATFSFWVSVPPQFNRFGESYNLVADGLTWMNPTGAWVVYDASQASYNWDFVGQSNYTDATKTTSIGWHATAAPGTKVYTVFKLKNSGTVPWYKNNSWPQVQLATWSPDRMSKSCDQGTWIRCTRIVTHTEDVVQPGQIATFEYWADTPTVSGQTNGESLNLVADGLVWFPNKGIYVKYTAQ